MLVKDFEVKTRLASKALPSKTNIEANLDPTKVRFGMGDLVTKYVPPPTNLEVTTSHEKRIAEAKVREDPKAIHRLFQRKTDNEKSHILQGIENVPPDKMDEVIVNKYLQDLSGPYTKLKMGLKPSPWYVNHIDTGTFMYATEHSTMITSKVKAMISTGKAVGFDPITDKFLKRNRNFRYLAD